MPLTAEIQLTEEQNALFERIENSLDHFFITGKAGTGKSVLLEYFRHNSVKKIVVAAPTGVAALNVGGQTIHSLFRIPPTIFDPETMVVDARTAKLLKSLDAVVIDEISMVRVDLMDAIDFILRKARKSDQPFGGVQMILFGDLYQLPPVINDPTLLSYFKETFGGAYFFNAAVWRSVDLEVCQLSTIFRQKDENFKRILNAIRHGEVDEEILSELNSRVVEYMPDENVITLAGTNSAVARINQYHLSHLESEAHTYKASVKGLLEPSTYPTDENLALKEGAQVMLLKNDKEKRWVNGTLGKIEQIKGEEIKVKINKEIYTIPKETWSKVRYSFDQAKQSIQEEPVSSFTQYPLRLAWAITIHKSQGQSYDAVSLDLGSGAFAHGQAYVALSRCRSLSGLYLHRPVRQEDIIVDPDIVRFMEHYLAA